MKYLGIIALFSLGTYFDVDAHTIDVGTFDTGSIHASADGITPRGRIFAQPGFFPINNSISEPAHSVLRTTGEFVTDTVSAACCIAWSEPQNASFADLAADTHMTDIHGTALLLTRATRASSASNTQIWLMIVIGIGLVIFQLRRTQRSLQHRPLAG